MGLRSGNWETGLGSSLFHENLVIEPAEVKCVIMARKPLNVILLSSVLFALNDGPRTQRKGHCREWVRGRHGPQAYPLTILKSLLSGCLHRVSISL